MVIEQLTVGGDNFSYIIWCPMSKKAAFVDPSYDVSKTLEFIKSKKRGLEYVINTHYHHDHSSGNKKVKSVYPAVKIVISKVDEAGLDIKADVTVEEGDRLEIGEVRLTFILTPGYTPGGLCIIVDNEALITGDTLFIGDCGRTDLPGGDLVQMYKTLHEKIMSLPGHLIVYPGHDYGDKPFDTLEHQKQTNKTLLAKSLQDFSKIP